MQGVLKICYLYRWLLNPAQRQGRKSHTNLLLEPLAFKSRSTAKVEREICWLDQLLWHDPSPRCHVNVLLEPLAFKSRSTAKVERWVFNNV